MKADLYFRLCIIILVIIFLAAMIVCVADMAQLCRKFTQYVIEPIVKLV
ncbi:hypothetical protein SALWKB12_1393 [Snodgrassella communis]|nr:hypothetical protein SALWKB12_1393 [Snodgrassella communis]